MKKRIELTTEYCIEQGIGGDYRLVRDGELIFEDPACGDLNEDKETAEAFFVQYIKDYVNVIHVKHGAYVFRVVEDEKFYHISINDASESHYRKDEYSLEDAIKEEIDD